MKWLDKNINPRTGTVIAWVSTRWGTKEPGPPDQQQRGRKGEERAQRGITGAVLRHRMLPFLISMRFWRKQQKGAKLKRALGNGQLVHQFGDGGWSVKSSDSEQEE